ncbi:hypothetical protein ACIBSV_11900 [Embleya sp. NPDC050154]|uniref:hypothetical protein n=1 Tax=Embleya sp. NPDC050154 TaxID=3363988 RepID=UPI00378F74D4
MRGVHGASRLWIVVVFVLDQSFVDPPAANGTGEVLGGPQRVERLVGCGEHEPEVLFAVLAVERRELRRITKALVADVLTRVKDDLVSIPDGPDLDVVDAQTVGGSNRTEELLDGPAAAQSTAGEGSAR